MNPRSFATFISSITLAATTVHSTSTHAESVSSFVTSSVTNGQSTAEATVSGQNGVITVNGDKVEIKDGRLSVNGIPYGTVGAHSVVKYTVNGKVKKLFVDGVERKPDK